jgi:hypothetical protein
MPYVCYHISKEVCPDDFEHGCTIERDLMMDEKCDITGETLPELMSAIGERYGIEIDCLFVPDPDKAELGYVSFVRTENIDGDEPSIGQITAWKQGMCRLFVADYGFSLTYRTSRPVTLAEFKASGVNYAC